jgi:transcriptional regulator with XRE-family HTH domain
MTPASQAEKHPHLGSRLRIIRETRALSLAELAHAAGVTKGYLSKVEREIATPSTATLLVLCEALGLSLGELFEATPHHDVIRAAERVSISLGGEGITESLISPSGERRLQALHSIIQPGGGSGPDLYSLPSEVEFAFILSGTISLTVEGVVHRLRKGDTITFSSQVPHSFRNDHPSRVATVLWVFSPALPSDFEV